MKEIISIHGGNDVNIPSLPKSSSKMDSPQIKKTVKRKSSWISSSFDAFEPSVSKVSGSSFEKDSFNCRKNKQDLLPSSHEEDFPWVEKYKPKAEAELAVHKKKIAEVRDWLCRNLSQRRGGILLLTGPSGCGKTAAIECLCSELGIEVQEWINPDVQTDLEFQANKSFELMWTDSQTKQFHDFLFRANRYSGIVGVSSQSSIPDTSVKRLICIEDLPTFIFRDMSKFQEMIRQYKRTSRNPLVFIMSDSFTGNSNLHSLFPRHLQMELKVTKISLNPVATTILIKTMTRIASQECKQDPKNIKNPTKNDLDLLASSCNGDIRSAINALQFSCTRGLASNTKEDFFGDSRKRKQASTKQLRSKTVKSSTTEKGKTVDQPDSVVSIGSRDSSLFLFRALGKILYCKREAGSQKEETKLLPSHLQNLAKDRLLIDPDEVVEKTRISGETVNLYLHQNFLDFYKDIDNVAKASENFSDADNMAGQWTSREQMSPYFTTVVPRAVVFYNNHNSSSSSGSSYSWKPLHKPQWFDTNKEIISHCEAVRHLFNGYRHPCRQLQIEVLPFLAKINPPLQTPSQISLLQTVTNFRFGKLSSRFSEPLTESEIGPTESSMSDTMMGSNFNRSDSSCSLAMAATSENQDEEDQIEDFDD